MNYIVRECSTEMQTQIKMITKTVSCHDIELIVSSLEQLTEKYPKDEALKSSLLHYQNIITNQ